MSKCFCHLNGYEVKDANARSQIENIINGTQSVANSSSLGNESSEQWQAKIDALAENTDASTFGGETPAQWQAKIDALSENVDADTFGGETPAQWESKIDAVESNKPIVTYVGNGGAATRTIEVGGTGNACIITGGSGCSIVSQHGAMTKTNAGTTVGGLDSTVCNFTNGVLTIKSTSGFVNTSGTTYTCAVI